MATFSAAFLCLTTIFSSAIVPSFAADYTVGDSGGWAMGVNYDTWASSKTFSVGDTLTFSYPSGHTVDEVNPSDYGTCTVGNAISSDQTGSTTITLKTAGSHYFICGIPGHCGAGMKLTIKVAEAPGSTTTPPQGGSTTTTTPPSTTTSPTIIAPPRAETTGQTLPSSCGTVSPFVAVFVSGVAMIFSLVL